jgi:hypothetical protein
MRRRSVETGAPNAPATAAVANGTQGRWIAGAALPRRLLWHNSRASFANETLSCMASPRSRLLPQRARFRSQPRARQARRDPVSPFRRRSGRARTWDRLAMAGRALAHAGAHERTETGHEPSPRLDDCEGSTAVARGSSPDVGNWHSSDHEEGAKPVGFAPVVQPSTCSAMARASSTSMPRYRTVLSSLWPAGHRLDYLPHRTMSRLALAPHEFDANGTRAGHSPYCQRLLRNARSLSSGR